MKRYSKYKETSIEWIGELPEHWEISRAKNYFYQSFEKGNEELTLLSATQSDGVVPKDSLEGVVQVREDADLSLFKSVHVGDYVISLRSFQGGFEMSNYEGVITPAYTVFRAKNEVCHRYYQKLFKQEAFISKINSLTVGIREGKNILFQDFANMAIPFPPLSEQTAIADYLDSKIAQIDNIIADKQNLINLLQEKRQIIISQSVTKGISKSTSLKTTGVPWIGDISENWIVFKIKYMFRLKGRIGWQGLKSDEYIEEGPYLITGTDFKDGGINWHTCVHISEERYIEEPEIHVKEGDLLITKDGTIGKVAIAQNVPEKVSLNSGVLLVRDNGRVDNLSKFIYYIILSNQFWYWFYSSLTGNSTILHLYQEKFKEFRFALPPIEEQREIVEYLDQRTAQIDSIIADITEQIEKLNEYRKVVISEAVTGKIKIAEDGECNVN